MTCFKLLKKHAKLLSTYLAEQRKLKIMKGEKIYQKKKIYKKNSGFI